MSVDIMIRNGKEAEVGDDLPFAYLFKNENFRIYFCKELAESEVKLANLQTGSSDFTLRSL